jgi:hypothetical protein
VNVKNQSSTEFEPLPSIPDPSSFKIKLCWFTELICDTQLLSSFSSNAKQRDVEL